MAYCSGLIVLTSVYLGTLVAAFRERVSVSKPVQDWSTEDFKEYLTNNFAACKKALLGLPMLNTATVKESYPSLFHGRLTWFDERKGDGDLNGWHGKPLWFGSSARDVAMYAGAGHLGFVYHPRFLSDPLFDFHSPRILIFQWKDVQARFLRLADRDWGTFEQALKDSCAFDTRTPPSGRAGIDKYKGFRRLAAMLRTAGILGAVEGYRSDHGALVIFNPEYAVQHAGNFVPKLECCSTRIDYSGVRPPVPLYSFAWQGANPDCDEYSLPVAKLMATHKMGYTVKEDAPWTENPETGFPVYAAKNMTLVHSPPLKDTLLVDGEGVPLFNRADRGGAYARCMWKSGGGGGLADPVGLDA